ncbi:unnamed protein product, partial [Laminaria digitata]
MLLPQRALHREWIPPRPRVRPHPLLRRLATPRLRLNCRLRAASRLGRAGKRPLPLALCSLLLIMASGAAGPLDHPPGVPTPCREFHGHDHLRQSSRPLLLTPCLSRRY